MENILLMKKSSELEQLSKRLGFSTALFLGHDFMLIDGSTKKEILSQIKKHTFLFYKAGNEEMLRFVLEKTNIKLIFGAERIHPYDSVHYVRSGLDPVLCAIAAERGKTIGFSFSDIFNSADKARSLSRMRQNIQLCRKYKVKMLFSTFARDKWELRSASDLEAFWRILGGRKEDFTLH